MSNSIKAEEGHEDSEKNSVSDEKMEIDEQDVKPEVDADSGVAAEPDTVEEKTTKEAEIEEDGEEEEEDLEKTCNGSVTPITAANISRRGVTLPMLLAAGILKPGDGTMSLEYHGQKFLGDLLETGQIRSQETSKVFSTPSAWAIACKQIINPDKMQRKSGCGWASIKYKSLKLDYYKTVWFKRLREGSIDLKSITNGAISSSEESEDEGPSHAVLKFGEHFEYSPVYQSAVMSGAQVLIECQDFKSLDRLQPFHVKMSVDAVALADFHCNITNTEVVGYLSGHWNSDQNQLNVETAHPCKILMPFSTTIDAEKERNRVALEIQALGHDVVGWYHSHPKAPAEPSKDDIMRQLDYQIMMKGPSEASYVPCVGLIISPMCYSNQDMKTSKLRLFWVLPPPESRTLDLGRPMKLDHEIIHASEVDAKKLMHNMDSVLNYYKANKPIVDLNDLSGGRFEKLKDTVSSWVPELKGNKSFWHDVKDLFKSPVPQKTNSVSVVDEEKPSVSDVEQECFSPSSERKLSVDLSEVSLDPVTLSATKPVSSRSNSFTESRSTPGSTQDDITA